MIGIGLSHKGVFDSKFLSQPDSSLAEANAIITNSIVD